MIEQLKIILEGTGTFVHKKMSNDEYLRPTPVIFTSNNCVWNLCPIAKGAILTRLIHFYDEMKSCPLLENITKELHPVWLNIFADVFLNSEKKNLQFLYARTRFIL